MAGSETGIKTSRMKIALIGYGKMGRAIESLALERGISVAGKIDPMTPFKDICPDTLQEADVCLDFSHPSSVKENIREAAALGKNLVVGTTGWYDQIPEIKRIVKASNIGLIYSPNFSLGVNLFIKLAAKAAELFNPFPEFDIGGFEIHHNQKADTPSGTAELVCETLLKYAPRKQSVVYGSKKVKDPEREIHYPSLRVGHVPGTHEVIFDSPAETVSISCVSRNRQSFAMGALLAADWIKERRGFFTFDDIINQILKDKHGIH